MKNLFTNSILNFLLILTLAFSPTITLAQEVIEAESEEPTQETVVEEQIPEVSIEVEEVVEVEEPIVHTNIINEVEMVRLSMSTTFSLRIKGFLCIVRVKRVLSNRTVRG